MAKQVIKTNIIKHNSAENWANSFYVPELNEIIVYDGDEEQFKVGDGVNTVPNLPFASDVSMTAGQGLSANDFTDAYKTKLDGIAANANNYTHPSSHAASMIVTDSTHRFVSDAQIEKWNSMAGVTATVELTQAEYDALTDKDASTLYVITEE